MGYGLWVMGYGGYGLWVMGDAFVQGSMFNV